MGRMSRRSGGKEKALPIFSAALLLVAAGCRTMRPSASPPSKKEKQPVIDNSQVLTCVDPEWQPEPVLFPAFLLLPELEIEQHGRIPGTPLVGAGLVSPLELPTLEGRLESVLRKKGWAVDCVERSPHAFRLQARKRGDFLELRAVRGDKPPTQLFLLYLPRAARSG